MLGTGRALVANNYSERLNKPVEGRIGSKRPVIHAQASECLGNAAHPTSVGFSIGKQAWRLGVRMPASSRLPTVRLLPIYYLPKNTYLFA